MQVPFYRKGHLKCKMDVSGAKATKVWNSQNEECELPSDVVERKLTVLCNVSHFWMQSQSFGLCVLAKHIKRSDMECPFNEDE